jgi:glycosyltransferase involved in cell wall biosynthesis
MADVSAVVVTLNEEENIRDCLTTLQWCDEIIVVDSHSQDSTVDIAKEFTDEIYLQEKQGYGDPARVKALEEAEGEWICMVDADERLPKKLVNQLKSEIKRDEFDVVKAPRKNFMFGEWINYAGWWPDYRSVLYKRKMVDISDSIHNFITISDRAKVKVLPKEETLAVVHFNYLDLYDFISRMNSYTDIEAQNTEYNHKKILIEPPKEFLQRFLLQGGYKLGFRGLFLSTFMAWYRFLTLAKIWQYSHWGEQEEIRNKYAEVSNKIINSSDEP